MAQRALRIRRLSIAAACVFALLAEAGCSGADRRATTRSEHKTPPLRRAAAPANRFEGDFRSRLRAADPSRRFVAIVDLTEQVDLKLVAKRLRDRSTSKAATRAAVLTALETVASRQQARLLPLLHRLQASGAVGSSQSVAIVNRMVVEGTAAALLEIGSSAEVAVVRPDWTGDRAASQADELATDPGAALGETFRSWAVEEMRADRLWALGLDGTGITVAAIDTGASESHEQLRDRRVAGERGWFDPVEGSTVANDRHGHGTGVLSQAVGGNPNGRVVGVAPGARWAASPGNWRNFYSRSRMTLAADWALRVARPDVLINAWSHDEGTCNDFDVPFIDAWKASGIFVVFAAGNSGPGPASGESPAQLGGIFPGLAAVFSVSALARSGLPDPLSSRGPSRCGSPAFPTVAAPGADLPVASVGGPNAYLVGRGTSLSAGLVGGAAALLLQASPETDPETLESVLVRSTRDIAPAGRDDDTGAGTVDLAAALRLLRPESPRP